MLTGIERRRLIGAAGMLAASPAWAASEVLDRPLRVVLPFQPGGSVDIIARQLSEPMRLLLGQPVVIENRPGANGAIALEATARAKPDGTTAMIGNVTTNGIAPVLNAKRLAIDYERDLVPVSRIADVPSLLVATTVRFEPKTLGELVALARVQPGKLNYFSTGVGSYPHIDTVLLCRAAGIQVEHVVLAGGAGGVLQPLLSGDVQFGFLNVASATPLVRDGKLRALAVTGDRRLPAWPEVPTMAEAGFPGIGTNAWHVMMVPTGVPLPVLDALFKATVGAIADPGAQAAFARQSIIPTPSASLDDARGWLAAELARWRTIIRETRIEAAD